MSENQRAERLKTPSRVALGIYVTCLLITTHLPHLPDMVLSLGAYDKWFHGGMYAGLVLLVAWNWSLHQALGWRQWCIVLVTCAGFAIADEASQLLVGRTCDLFDWLADMLGASLGLATFVAGSTYYRRPRQMLGVGGR